MHKDRLETIKHFVSGFAGSASFMLLYCCFQNPIPQIGAVNINRLVNDHIKERSHTSLSVKELQMDSDRYMNKLEQALQDLSKKENLHLIVSDAVVSGSKDYTESVRLKIKETQ